MLEKETDHRFSVEWKNRYPILDEKTRTTSFDAHYLYHPAWAARILRSLQPEFHIDISSTLNFAVMVSAFIPVEYYEFRPVNLSLSGLTCKSADLLHLPFPDGSVESLSCMHVIEHIGLGRYGDPLDPTGDLKAMDQLKRVVKKGGALLFVVPIGKPKICFNAHRIYSYNQIASCFSDFTIEQFALVDDHKKFIIDADPSYADNQKYGCGCWWFKKKGI